jgi:hypothetical protein
MIRPWNGWPRRVGTVARAKSDRRGAKASADLVGPEHRNLAEVGGDRLWAEAIKVLAGLRNVQPASGRSHSAFGALTS